jgi:hypothetical protein
MLVWPARCASQPKNVQARRAPAGGSIRPGLNIAEHLPRTPGRLSGTGRTDLNFIAAPLKGNLSKVSLRDSRLPSSALQSGVLAAAAQPESRAGGQNASRCLAALRLLAKDSPLMLVPCSREVSLLVKL